MNKRLKQLLIACHPDRHGGDHSRMEEFFAITQKSRAGLVKQPHRCQFPGCGVAVTPHSRACRAHWRVLRRTAIAAALVVLVGCATPTPSLPSRSLAASQEIVTQSAASVAPVTRTAIAAAPSDPVIGLAWDASPSPGVTGYRLHWTTNAGVYQESALLGANTTVTLPVVKGAAYRIAVTAVGADGAESDFSNEVSVRLPLGIRTERLVLEIYETLGGPKVGETILGVYTNTIPGSAQKYLRLRQELMGVE